MQMTYKKEENLLEWFTKAVSEANIYDYGDYPVKGCGIWLPNGFELKQRVIEIIRELLKSTNHKEVQFPLLIPKEMLEKEAQHIAGFLDQVFWVTKGGDSQLGVELALRPTSETPMTFYFKKLIFSYKDLPLKVFQIVSIFRYETKATHPMIRVREVTMFKEAFTFHSSFEDAVNQTIEAYKIYSKFFEILCIPVVVVERPEWDKFPGADVSIAFDTILPNGKSLQVGSIHNLGQRFAKAFDLMFTKPDGTREFVYQTSYGISERVIASMIFHHGDEIGVILLPNLAPIQIVIVPIIYEENKNEILNYSREIYDIIKVCGYRVVLDDDFEKTPGEKFYKWERMGVPLRIEIGPRETRERSLLFALRIGEKYKVKFEDFVKEIKNAFYKVKEKIREKAYKSMFEKLVEVKDLNEAKKVVENKKVAVISICTKRECGEAISKEKEVKFLGYDFEKNKEGNCIICGEKSNKIGYICESY